MKYKYNEFVKIKNIVILKIDTEIVSRGFED